MIEENYDIILIGGAKGTGKSTITKKISEITGKNHLHTGTLFLDADKNLEIYEKMLFEKVAGFSGIMDTHYAGYHADGFCRGISEGLLKNIGKMKTGLVLIELDVDTLYERRMIDKKIRIMDKKHMSEELYWNRKYFNEYCDELRIEGKSLSNYDLENTINGVIGYLGGKNG